MFRKRIIKQGTWPEPVKPPELWTQRALGRG